MNTLDLDALAGMTPEQMEQQEITDNRPTWRTNPIVVEGDWDGKLVHGTETTQNGTEIPQVVMHLRNCKFVEVGPQQIGMYTDGQDYMAMTPAPKLDNKDYQRAYGMMLKAAGAPLASFKGRVRLTEQAKKPFPSANNPTWFWKIERIGGSANGTAPAAIPDELVNAALQVIAGNQFTRTNVGMGLMKSPSCNTSATLNGKFADGSFIKEMEEAGRVKEVDGVLTA